MDEDPIIVHEAEAPPRDLDATPPRIPILRGPALSAALTLSNATIGAGVLTLPLGFSMSGLLGGTLIAFVAMAVQTSTLCILTRAAAKHGSASFQEVVARALGEAWARLLTWIIFVYQFGSCCAYLILLGDSWETLLTSDSSSRGAFSLRTVGIVVVGTCVVLPLSMPRTIGAIANAGSVSIAGLAYTAAAVVVRGCERLASWDGRAEGKLSVLNLDPMSIVVLPLFVFAFNCHVTVVPIFSEMAGQIKSAEPHRPAAALQRCMDKVCGVAMTTCLFGYLLVGCFGYVYSPHHMPSNILDAYPDGDDVIAVSRAAMGFVATVAYPVNLFPGRLALGDLLEGAGLGGLEGRGHYVATSVWYMGTLGVALVVTDLGVVFQVLGGTAAVMLIFIVPALLLVPPPGRPVGLRAPEEGAGLEDALMPADEEAWERWGEASPGGGGGAAGEGQDKVVRWQLHAAKGGLITLGCLVFLSAMVATWQRLHHPLRPVDQPPS